MIWIRCTAGGDLTGQVIITISAKMEQRILPVRWNGSGHMRKVLMRRVSEFATKAAWTAGDARRTPEQRAALRLLVHQLQERFPGCRVCGHRDLSPDRNGNGEIEPEEWIKACPCFEVKEESYAL